MSYKPLVSIITVCYNEKNVERTCKSIVQQTFQDFEWIVIDGGSNRETLEIFDKYKDRMNVFISEKDDGVYNAMNKGIKRAKGLWLNFMNAGDTFFEDKTLEKVFKNSALKRADILYSKSKCFMEDGTGFCQKFPLWHRLNYTFWQSNCLNHQACFFKKELFEKYGLYDERFKIRADFEKLLLFLTGGCKFEYINILGCNFFMDGISSKNTDLLNKETEEIMQRYYPFKYRTIRTIKLLNKIPVMRIKKRWDNKKCRLVFLKISLFEWECKEKV